MDRGLSSGESMTFLILFFIDIILLYMMCRCLLIENKEKRECKKMFLKEIKLKNNMLKIWLWLFNECYLHRYSGYSESHRTCIICAAIYFSKLKEMEKP